MKKIVNNSEIRSQSLENDMANADKTYGMERKYGSRERLVELNPLANKDLPAA